MSDERGFLTRTDREFLTGEHEYTGDSAKQQRYQRREAIAERTRQALLDFRLLRNTLDAHERARVFELNSGWDHDKAVKYYRMLPHVIAFMYLAFEGEADNVQEAAHEAPISFERILEMGVKYGERDRYARDIDTTLIEVTFDVEKQDLLPLGPAVDRLIEEGPGALTEAEMFAILYRYGPDSGPDDVSLSDLDEYIKQRQREDVPHDE